MPGAVAVSAKRCPCAIVHIENFQINNPLNSALKIPKHCLYLVALVHKRLHTAMAATTAEKSDGYRN